MKYLVLGCNGMLGHIVAAYLDQSGHDVSGLAKGRSKIVNTIISDATNIDKIKEVVCNGKWDAIINCIGLLNNNAEDHKSDAVFINSFLPHLLAKITSNTSTQIVQISTDCVFSGTKGNYHEYDLRDGETFYDRSKALGELDDDKNITLRCSIVGPDMKEEGIGLLNWFMKQSGDINGYNKAIWTGQTTLQLAKTIEFVTKNRITGIYNAVPDSSISKYDLLMIFNKYLRQNRCHIIPNEKISVNKSLVNTRKDIDFLIPEYDLMVAEMALWINNHKEWYPHYFTE